MKKSLLTLSLGLATLATAGETVDTMQYGLPDSGLAPSFAEATYISRLRQRHGGSHMSMQSYALTIPLADPRKSHWNEWMINAQLDSKITMFETGGSLTLKDEVLYNVALPISLIKPMSNGNRITLGVAPEIATDGNAIEHGLDLAAYGLYTIRRNESFSYTIGVGISPRFAVHGAVPFFGFQWKPNENWTVHMQGYKLTALYKVTDKWSVGPFANAAGGIWSVETERGDEYFRLRSLVLGVTSEYDFSAPGQTKRIFAVSIGTNVATNAEFLKRNAEKDAVESHHYKPGLYVSAAVDFRF